MAASPYSVTPPPPVVQTPTAAPQSAPAPAAPLPLQPAVPQAPQDTVALSSPPLAKSLIMSDRLLARIDQETARLTAGAQPQGAQQAAADPAPEAVTPPKHSVPPPDRPAHQQGRDTTEPQKQAASNGLIPMQVMQGKAKALAQSGRSPEEIALELHLDLKTVEEYLGGPAESSAAGEKQAEAKG